MNRYKRIKDQIMVPSETAQRELREKIEAARTAPGGNLWLRRALPMAACLLLVIGGTFGALRLWKPAPVIPDPILNGDGKITGLPVKRELLSDMPSDGAIASDRMLIASLRDFFDLELYTFVLARVTDTKSLPPEYEYGSDRQRATLEILEWAYDQPLGVQGPVIITLTQSRLGGCTMEEQTNLLRPGGVYILPLVEFEGEYYLMGDMDVLFEVDEQGNLYSHSDFENFAAYDGKPWDALMEDVQAIVRDDPMVVTYSRFARVLREGVPLAEITILDGGTVGNAGGGPYVSQRARAENVLRQGTGKSYHVRLEEGEFQINTFGEEAQAQVGERYLVFVYGNEHEYSFEANRAAKINADGTIEPLTEDWSAFSQLAGMTVEQVRTLIDKAG